MFNSFMAASMRRSASDQELINALLKINDSTGTASFKTALFLHMREPDLELKVDNEVADLLAAIILVDCAPADKVTALKQQLGITSSTSKAFTPNIRTSFS